MQVRRKGVARLVKVALGEAITGKDKTAYMDKNGIVRVRKATASISTTTKARIELLGTLVLLAGKNSRLCRSSNPDALNEAVHSMVAKLCESIVNADMNLLLNGREGKTRKERFTSAVEVIRKALGSDAAAAATNLRNILNGTAVNVCGKTVTPVSVSGECKSRIEQILDKLA